MVQPRSRSRLAADFPVTGRDGRPRFSFDGNFNLGARLEAYPRAILVGQSVLDAELTIEMIGAFHRELSLFGRARKRRLYNLFDSRRQSGTWFIAHKGSSSRQCNRKSASLP